MAEPTREPRHGAGANDIAAIPDVSIRCAFRSKSTLLLHKPHMLLLFPLAQFTTSPYTRTAAYTRMHRMRHSHVARRRRTTRTDN